MILNCTLENVGNTPMARLAIPDFPGINLFAKLEYYNPTGSVKDRAAIISSKNCSGSEKSIGILL